MENALKDIRTADKIIKKRHRYFCGLIERPEEGLKASNAALFFESPDGQNGELYSELLNLGYRTRGYKAPYFWKVYKDGYQIEYVEGDVYVTRKCPSCGKDMHGEDVRNALSRYCSKYICNDCGIREAMEGDFWHAAAQFGKLTEQK